MKAERLEFKMNKHGNILISLFLINSVCSFKSLLGQVLQERYTWRSFLDNHVSQDTTSIIVRDSLARCAQSCSVDANCVSFFFLKSSRYCNLLDHTIATEALTIPENGWKYYEQVVYNTVYTATLLTGDVTDGGSNSYVYIQFFGVNGKSTQKFSVDDEKDNFERNMVDEFELEVVDVAPLDHIVIENVPYGSSPDWYLEYVKVKRYLRDYEKSAYEKSVPASQGRPLYEEYYFPCQQWLAENKGDGLLVRQLQYSTKTIIYENTQG